MMPRSLSRSLRITNLAEMGHSEPFFPVFKTGRAGQPPAWKVRFLRRVVGDRSGAIGAESDGLVEIGAVAAEGMRPCREAMVGLISERLFLRSRFVRRPYAGHHLFSRGRRRRGGSTTRSSDRDVCADDHGALSR